MFVLLFASIIFVQFLLAMPIIALVTSSNFIDTPSMNGYYALMGILLIVFVFFFIACIITLANGLLGGLYVVYKKADHNEMYTTSDMFVLLKGNRIFKTFRVSILQLLVILVSYLMCVFPIIYTSIPISYIIVIYAFNQDLSATEIVKLAFAIGNKNWVQTFLLRLVTSFVSMLGIFLCGIGIFATFAIVLIPLYYVYKHAIGFDDQNELNSIGQSEEI